MSEAPNPNPNNAQNNAGMELAVSIQQLFEQERRIAAMRRRMVRGLAAMQRQMQQLLDLDAPIPPLDNNLSSLYRTHG